MLTEGSSIALLLEAQHKKKLPPGGIEPSTLSYLTMVGTDYETYALPTELRRQTCKVEL